jgi:sugar lactone lactonase YvrE
MSVTLSFRILAFIIAAALLLFCSKPERKTILANVSTIAGANGEFGEPFGLAVHGSDVFVSDGANGKIIRLAADGTLTEFAGGFETPSAIAFTKGGELIVADSGSHTIKSVKANGEVTIIAGVEGRSGFADGDGDQALFNGPIGVAVAEDGRIFVSDTYNDRIRVISKGKASTFAGSERGYRDGGLSQFDTPLGIAIWKDKILVADAGNGRVRVVEPDGSVWTLAGTGNRELLDGPLLSSSFVQPTAIAVNESDQVFIADDNVIRMIGRGVFPVVTTLSGGRRGFRDGRASRSRFGRPSGLAIGQDAELLVADSDNGFIRRIGEDAANVGSNIDPKQFTPDEFKRMQPPRWPYEPPDAKRDVAGTLGEIRGTIPPGADPARFHNGLDIAGQYGENAYFIRSEKVLDPISADNFGTSRELIRLPQIGYIHLRLGRDANDRFFPNSKYQPQYDPQQKLVGLRVPRGTKFKAGDLIGTLNAMNHVHLIAGPSGHEINALAALGFPNISDSIAPVIESTALFDQSGTQIETKPSGPRIKLDGKYRIIVRAFDQMDGNSGRRKLGVYKLGYQVIREGGTPAAEINWSIIFDKMPPGEAVRFVYGEGSHSGATGETIFNYIVTNHLSGDDFGEDSFDTSQFPAGNYIVRVYAGDYFGNISTKDIPIEVIK